MGAASWIANANCWKTVVFSAHPYKRKSVGRQLTPFVDEGSSCASVVPHDEGADATNPWRRRNLRRSALQRAVVVNVGNRARSGPRGGGYCGIEKARNLTRNLILVSCESNFRYIYMDLCRHSTDRQCGDGRGRIVGIWQPSLDRLSAVARQSRVSGPLRVEISDLAKAQVRAAFV